MALSTQETLSERLRVLLRQKQSKYSLRRFLMRLHFADLADVMQHNLSREEAIQCFQHLPPAQASQVLPSLEWDRKLDIIRSLTPVKASRLIHEMAVDEAVDLLQALETDERRRILGEMPVDADTQTLHQLLIEAPDTAAGIMSTDFIKVFVDATVGDALDLVLKAEEKDFIYYTYLVDRDNKLVGVVSMKTLVIHDNSTPLQDVACFDVKSVLESFDQELAANLFRKYYNLLAMPVVDNEDRLLGVITMDDIIDVIDEESQEDLFRTGGIVMDDAVEEHHIISRSVWHGVKARLPWLSITLVNQLLVASVIAFFDTTVSNAVKAFSFLPLLCGLAGNTGLQSDTITVRGIALNQVRPDNLLQQLCNEVRVSSVMALVFATSLGLISFLLYHHLLLSSLLFGYLLLSLTTSSAMGVVIATVLKYRFNKDPAGVGGPMITAIMDLSLYLLYLTTLTWLGSRII